MKIEQNQKTIISLALITFLVVFLSACIKKTYQSIYPTLSDGRYDSEFPYKNASDAIDKIAESVVKVYSAADYITYYFANSAHFNKNRLQSIGWEKYAEQISTSNKSVSGTATVILNDSSSIAFLSCAHIVNYPDTIFSYYDITEIGKEPFIRSVTLKIKQRNYIRELNEDGLVEILAIDNEQDIAILGKKTKTPCALKPIYTPFGKAQDLEWGSFVYVMGFPLGNKMITKGIVSKLKNNNVSSAFIIDAMFNKGFSGGIVLAIRDGVPNFELVGIVKSVSSNLEYALIPEKDYFEFQYNYDKPYDGNTYVKLKEVINYGITYAVPIEAIVDFFQRNQKQIFDKGYKIQNFNTAGIKK